MCVSHRTGVDMYCTLYLRLGRMTQKNNFHWKMSSEQQVTCLPLMFWPNWEKKHYNTSRLSHGDKSNDRLAHITSNRANDYVCSQNVQHCVTVYLVCTSVICRLLVAMSESQLSLMIVLLTFLDYNLPSLFTDVTNDAASCSNFPQKPTSTTQIRNITTRYRCESGQGKAIVLNTGWLCTCPKIDFGSFLTKKRLRTAALASCT